MLDQVPKGRHLPPELVAAPRQGALVQEEVRVREDLGVEGPRPRGPEEPLPAPAPVAEQVGQGAQGVPGVAQELGGVHDGRAGLPEDRGAGGGGEGVARGRREDGVGREVEVREELLVRGVEVQRVELFSFYKMYTLTQSFLLHVFSLSGLVGVK